MCVCVCACVYVCVYVCAFPSPVMVQTLQDGSRSLHSLFHALTLLSFSFIRGKKGTVESSHRGHFPLRFKRPSCSFKPKPNRGINGNHEYIKVVDPTNVTIALCHEITGLDECRLFKKFCRFDSCSKWMEKLH